MNKKLLFFLFIGMMIGICLGATLPKKKDKQKGADKELCAEKGSFESWQDSLNIFVSHL